MFTNEHITFLREQLTRAEENAAGWRALLTYAQANMANPLFAPAGGNPYPTDTRVFPAASEDPRAAWTPQQEQRFQAFEQTHGSLCRDDTGPEKADTCVLPVGHDGPHEDGDGHRWQRSGS